VGVLFATGVFSKQPVVVETPMQRPHGHRRSLRLLGAEGFAPRMEGSLEFQGAHISVPPGAVPADTTLEVKVLQGDST